MARGVRRRAHHPAIRLAGNRASEFPFSVSGSSFLCRYGCSHRFGLGKEYVEARLENCGRGPPVHVHCPGRHGHAPQWGPPERQPRSPGGRYPAAENRLCRHAQIALGPGGPARNRRTGAGAPGRRHRTGWPLQADRARRLRIRIGSLAETAPLALDRIDAINPPRQGDRSVLSGRASLGGNLARGNTDAQTLHLDGELVARNASQRVTLDGELNEAAQDGVETASNWRVGVKYDHFASERFFYYANTRFDHDGQAGLDLRSTLGAGAGRQLFERDDLKLSLEGGLSLVNEDYAHAADTRFPSARFGARYEQTVWQGRLKLFHNSDLLLSLESLDDYFYQSRTRFRVPMGKGFSLGSQVNFDYDAVPAAGKGNADTALLFKLDYTI